MTRKWKVFVTAVVWAVTWALSCLAQMAAQGTVFTVDVENVVNYIEDPVTVDLSKVGGTVPGVTPGTGFQWHKSVRVGDITTVNGQPVKGTMFFNWRGASIRPNAVGPGPVYSAIGDITRDVLLESYFEILGLDGSQIGTIVGLGMGGGTSPPGAPLAAAGTNVVIVGGSGAFLGVRGYMGVAPSSSARSASMTEDAANRRINGGGKMRFVLHLIPMSRPEVVATPNGPAVAHSSDFTLVSSAKPAAAGELLSVFATGLGPVRPGVDPGQPFPSRPLAAVSSPVQVLVNGKPAEVLAADGFPGAVDGYQVNFRLPPETARGTATLQLSAAWIAGPEFKIPVQ